MLNKSELTIAILKDIVYACVDELNGIGDISPETMVTRIDAVAQSLVKNYKGICIDKDSIHKPLTLLIQYTVDGEIGVLPVELNLYTNFGD